MEIIFLIIGLIVGVGVGYLLAKVLTKSDSNNESQIAELDKQNSILDKEKSLLEQRISDAIEKFREMETVLSKEREKNTLLEKQLSETNANHSNLQQKLTEQKEEVEAMQTKFKIEFENIANKILEEKSKKFTAQNKENLDMVLKPLGEKIKDFESTIEARYIKTTKDQTSLMEQVKMLSDLNEKMRTDAQNLTKALKGDSKAQGNWGEFVLQKILEASGLREGIEYQMQHSTTNEEGRRVQPDVVINLPDQKHIIVDSKVSLTAYEQFTSSTDATERITFLRNHLLSVKKHIKELSEKNYQSAAGIKTPDFVLLFIPVEPSFSLAVQEDSAIFSYAWERKIVLVSPSTLLATLRTIASVWKQEQQNKNAEEIAQQAGRLYDKFVGFLEDMERIDSSIKGAQKSYDEAIGKLESGKGNLVGRAQKLRELGLKTKKQIPEKFVPDITDED